MVLAPVATGRAPELRKLLATMNRSPGIVDPQNAVVPFARFSALHFARFVVLEDVTTNEIAAYGVQPGNYPIYLAFMADFDGERNSFTAELVRIAGQGLRQIFSYCEGFSQDADLTAWIAANNVPIATNYVNWLGRTSRQVGEESALHTALAGYVGQNAAGLAGLQPQDVHQRLRQYIRSEQQAGCLSLAPEAPTPLGWRIRNFAHCVGVLLALLLLLPFLLVYLPFFLIMLRREEKSDPAISYRVALGHANQLALLEDHDVTNQFTVMGSLKPGWFPRSTLVFLLWVANWTTQHFYNRGRLARISTIHFARWVFMDDKQRLVFASNYDASLEGYMDDFINKVGFGLNLVFGVGVGYPRTRFLILDGAKDEQKFKYVLRRHELPTEVWYNAHPGLTALDRHRNSMIREGLEQDSLSDVEARQWLQLI
jgi:hypothetical protein